MSAISARLRLLGYSARTSEARAAHARSRSTDFESVLLWTVNPAQAVTPLTYNFLVLMSDPREVGASGGLDQEIVPPWSDRRYHRARTRYSLRRCSTARRSISLWPNWK